MTVHADTPHFGRDPELLVAFEGAAPTPSWSSTPADGTPGDWGAVFVQELQPRARHARRPPPGRRIAPTTAVLAIDVLAIALTLGSIHGAIRLLVGLAFVLAVPGWAVVGYLRLVWPAAEASLGLAASLAIVLLGSEVMLWVHQWHPVDLQVVLGAVSAVLLIGQLVRALRQGPVR